MSDATFSNPSPQFGTAEYVGKPENDHCQFCHQAMAGTYYRVNDSMACPACAEKMRGELAKDTHAAYMRGLLFGIGAALVGMIFYSLFAVMTGIVIGYLSLAVGWLVATAIVKGSRGVGGRRYQLTAAFLTYAAVSMAAVPVGIHYAITHRTTQKHVAASKQTPADEEFERQEQKANPNYEPDSRVEAPVNSSVTPTPEVRVVQPKSVAQILGGLILIGIASPFVEVWEGGLSPSWAIGLVILFVGIRIAWRIAAGRPLQIYGPFENSKPAV
jgi:hypothetical protein